MKYSKVFIDSIGYELAPHIVTTEEIEQQLKPFYDAVGFRNGQLLALTGIKERRYWDIDHTLAQGAAKAGQKAIELAGVSPDQIDCVVFCGVGRDGFEPATACAVADALKVSPDAHVYDVSNACLGVITGMVHVANAIELGQIKAGLVVSCETARQIVESTIDEIIQAKSVEFYKKTIATMTGGSGAVGVLMTDGTLGNKVVQGKYQAGQSINNGHPDQGTHEKQEVQRHALLGGVVKQASQFNNLCRWTFSEPGMPTTSRIQMRTNAQGVLENGLVLAKRTYTAFIKNCCFPAGEPDKFICHQVGSTHQNMVQQMLNINPAKDFSTYQYLGNMGTVSLPLTAAIADERGFLMPGDNVGFMGIGSGLNCLILGVKW
ncbi:MAG: ketoacyl-ACP synthase III [Desulfamplus sp.]|nr:ketoacyl-ACP synthase III [Desulfamplus sp.]